MKAHEIISAVQDTAGSADHSHAEQAVRATLTVLGQRLSTEAGDLAAQLPPPVSTHAPSQRRCARRPDPSTGTCSTSCPRTTPT